MLPICILLFLSSADRIFLILISSEYPSAYVVFPVISAGNACTQVGKKYTSVTMSFAPGELSTIDGPGGATKAFNFADLPCPPPDVAAADSFFYNPKINPGRQYSPQIAPPTERIWKLDPAFPGCVPAINQGFDPPAAVQPLLKPQVGGFQGRHGLHPRRKPAPAHTHQVPQTLTRVHGPD